jgi:drug/metabolite transporter (DMT)-like permease
MLPYLWMLTSAFAFACMSELAGALQGRCHWMITALARTSLAFVFTGCFAAFHRTPLVLFGTPTLWMRSLAGSVSLLCSFYALHALPPSDAIAVTNTFPIWVAVLSWPILGERPRWEVWVAVLCSVTGAVLMNQSEPHEGRSSVNLGVVAACVSSFLSGLVVIGLNLLHRIPSSAIVVHFSAVATLFTLAMLPRANVTTSDFRSLTPPTIGLLLALGLAATVGQLFLTKAFAAGPASKVAVVALVQVVFCALFEFGFLDRRFHTATILGMILVIVPTAWMMLRRDASKLSAMTVAGNE